MALTMLGFRVKSVFAHELSLTDLRDRYVSIGLEIAREFDAVEDMPWPLMFRELDFEFPESKFILTVRDTDRWFASISSHFGRGKAVLQQLTFGEDAPCPVGNEARYRAVYEAHNKAVERYFANRPEDLFIMDMERGDGWPELCQFLHRSDVPDGPFICTNTRAERELHSHPFKRLFNRMKVLLPS